MAHPAAPALPVSDADRAALAAIIRAPTTWALLTERGGAATLRIALDAERGAVAECALLVARRQHPDESW